MKWIGRSAQLALDERGGVELVERAARAAWMMAGRDERDDFRPEAPLMMAVVEGLHRCLVWPRPRKGDDGRPR
jgi:hypothetical protein